jgi:hypothetical protein
MVPQLDAAAGEPGQIHADCLARDVNLVGPEAGVRLIFGGTGKTGDRRFAFGSKLQIYPDKASYVGLDGIVRRAS